MRQPIASKPTAETAFRIPDEAGVEGVIRRKVACRAAKRDRTL